MDRKINSFLSFERIHRSFAVREEASTDIQAKVPWSTNSLELLALMR